MSWSAAGRSLYYLALESVDHASVWSASPQGGQSKLVVRSDDPGREWHRYGSAVFAGRFHFTPGDRQSDVWTADVKGAR